MDTGDYIENESHDEWRSRQTRDCLASLGMREVPQSQTPLWTVFHESIDDNLAYSAWFLIRFHYKHDQNDAAIAMREITTSSSQLRKVLALGILSSRLRLSRDAAMCSFLKDVEQRPDTGPELKQAALDAIEQIMGSKARKDGLKRARKMLMDGLGLCVIKTLLFERFGFTKNEADEWLNSERRRCGTDDGDRAVQ